MATVRLDPARVQAMITEQLMDTVDVGEVFEIGRAVTETDEPVVILEEIGLEYQPRNSEEDVHCAALTVQVRCLVGSAQASSLAIGGMVANIVAGFENVSITHTASTHEVEVQNPSAVFGTVMAGDRAIRSALIRVTGMARRSTGSSTMSVVV